MSLNNFISNFEGGYRPNRFKIEIDGINTKLEFMCRSAAIPSSEIGVVNIPYQGVSVDVPGDRPGGRTWEVEIFADTDFKIREDLELWQELIRPQEAPGGLNVSGAVRTATVDLLDLDGNVIRTYKMLRCWPTVLGELALAQETTDTIAVYPVTFAFTSWTSV